LPEKRTIFHRVEQRKPIAAATSATSAAPVPKAGGKKSKKKKVKSEPAKQETWSQETTESVQEFRKYAKTTVVIPSKILEREKITRQNVAIADGDVQAICTRVEMREQRSSFLDKFEKMQLNESVDPVDNMSTGLRREGSDDSSEYVDAVEFLA
jgi:hypothetical protein